MNARMSNAVIRVSPFIIRDIRFVVLQNGYDPYVDISVIRANTGPWARLVLENTKRSRSRQGSFSRMISALARTS